MANSSIWPQVLAALSASLTMLCSGFHMELSNTIIQELTTSGIVQIKNISWILSAFVFGSIGGPIFGFFLVDILGRRLTLMLMAVPSVVSCALISLAGSNIWCYVLAWFVLGLVFGVSSMVVPMYICEIADKRIRGGLCTLMLVMICIGRLLVYAISFFTVSVSQAIIGGVIAIVFAAALFWAPESPYYYAMKKLPNKTLESLVRLRGTTEVEQEAEEIQNSMKLNQRSALSFLRLFTVLSNRKALLVGCGLVLAVNISGRLVISAHSINIAYRAGIASFHLVAIGTTLISLLTSIIVVFLVDKIGRKPLLLASVSLCAFFLLVEALYFTLQRDTTADMSNGSILTFIPVLALIGYLISFSLGLGPLSYVITGEIFPCEVKAFALAICTVFYFAIGLALNFLITYLMYGVDVDVLILFYVYAACNSLSAIFIYFVVPETKGRSLHEIETAFQGYLRPQM